LESRTHASRVKLKSREVRDLVKGKKSLQEDSPAILGKPFKGTSKAIKPNPHFVPRVGKNVPNPLYAHLFDAFVFEQQWKTAFQSPLPSLEEQVRRWMPYAEPLEDKLHPFGLTPYGTYRTNPELIKNASERFLELPTADFASIRLINEKTKLSQVEGFIKKFKKEKTASELRELWFLLFSYSDLFLDIEVE
jgi:hypothetical protein